MPIQGILEEDEEDEVVMELREVTAKEYEKWMRTLERNMSQQDYGD